MKQRKQREVPMGVLMYTVEQVAAVCNLGVSTVWKMAKKEDSAFPQPIYFGARTARWKVDDVKNWVKKLGKEAV